MLCWALSSSLVFDICDSFMKFFSSIIVCRKAFIASYWMSPKSNGLQEKNDTSQAWYFIGGIFPFLVCSTFFFFGGGFPTKYALQYVKIGNNECVIRIRICLLFLFLVCPQPHPECRQQFPKTRTVKVMSELERPEIFISVDNVEVEDAIAMGAKETAGKYALLSQLPRSTGSSSSLSRPLTVHRY